MSIDSSFASQLDEYLDEESRKIIDSAVLAEEQALRLVMLHRAALDEEDTIPIDVVRENAHRVTIASYHRRLSEIVALFRDANVTPVSLWDDPSDNDRELLREYCKKMDWVLRRRRVGRESGQDVSAARQSTIEGLDVGPSVSMSRARHADSLIGMNHAYLYPSENLETLANARDADDFYDTHPPQS